MCSSPKLSVASNLESFLRTVTPMVPSKPIPQMDDINCESPKAVTHYYTLGDLWQCYDEWSVYGVGTPVVLDDGDKLTQYYAPYLSAVQIYTNKSYATSKDESGVVDLEIESWSDDSDSEKLSRSLSNNSSKGWDTASADSSESLWTVTDRLGSLYFQYFDTCSPYFRIPLFEKIDVLRQKNPGIMTLKSTDLSPASWMAVAWYPIYPIPNKLGHVKDLFACFLSFHSLSSPFQEMTVVDDDEDTWTSISSCLGVQADKALGDGEGKGSGRICLPPFGLAKYKVHGDVWVKEGTDDGERLSGLHNAANSWLKQLNVQHHDFNFFNAHSSIEAAGLSF
ncbi:hypothetical protein LguiB_022484 [Lonicera macranthoides]